MMDLMLLIAQTTESSSVPPDGWASMVPFWQVSIVVTGLISALGFLGTWIKILYNRVTQITEENREDREDLLKVLGKELDDARIETINTLKDKADRLEQVATGTANLKNSIDNLTIAVKELKDDRR